MAVRGSYNHFEKGSEFPDRRGQTILSAIIGEHLITGEPVGSKAIAEKFVSTYGLSSATIRNVMGELEERGFLEQPHTSAGRVPTDRGYRFYVDNLMGILRLSDDDLRYISEEFGTLESELQEAPDKILERTSHVLSALSNNIGIVVSPSLAHDRLQHIEFVNLSEGRILVILVSAPNIVHNKIIRLRDLFPQDELDRTARYLNAEFGGKSLAEIRVEILRLMHEEKSLFDKMLQTAIILCSQSIESEDDNLGEVYVDGASNILAQRDFTDMDRIRGLLRTIEEKTRLMRILNECIDRKPNKGNVQVVIGSENASESLSDCTLITAPYKIGGGLTIGTLGVLGPTRLEYARIISIVGYIARILEKMMSKNVGNN